MSNLVHLSRCCTRLLSVPFLVLGFLKVCVCVFIFHQRQLIVFQLSFCVFLLLSILVWFSVVMQVIGNSCAK